MYTPIKKITIDFDQLEKWRSDDENHFPILCFFHIYKALGLTPDFEKYHEKTNELVCAVQQIYCNFSTLRRLQYLIKNNWETYNITIAEDNNPQWKAKALRSQRKHPKKVIAAVRNSINYDFANFCPGIDDDLDMNVITFSDGTEQKEKE